LWLGNNSHTFGVLPDVWSPYLNTALRKEYIAKSEIAFMQDKKTEAINYIASDPGRFLRATWYRFIETWLGVDGPFVDVWARYSWKGRIPLVSNLIVVLIGLAGLLCFCREKSGFFFPCAISLLIYPVVYYVTHPALRYRLPIDPVLVVMAAFAITYPAVLATRRKSVRVFDSGLTGSIPKPAASDLCRS
jgi:hypothetical protein